MIKIRMQGTKEEMDWLEKKIQRLKYVEITESSDTFSNKGTNRYFRKYLEIENKETVKNR